MNIPTNPEEKHAWVNTVSTFATKAIFVLAVLLFVGIKIVSFAQGVYATREELYFAYTHANLVKPIRVLYVESHKKVDEDLKIAVGGK